MKFILPLFLVSLGALLADAADTNVLRRVEVAANLTAEECPEPRPFDFTGVAFDPTSRIVCFHDGSAGLCFENHTDGSVWQAGDRIRIRGEVELSPDDQAFYRVRTLDVLSHGALPPPASASGDEITRGTFTYRRARVRGTVASVVQDELDRDTGWLMLKTQTGPVLISFSTQDDGLRKMRRLIDAEVELSGLVRQTSGWRHYLSHHLSLGSREPTILKPVPADPFSAPSLRSENSLHRQCTTGVVAARGNGRFFLVTPRGRFVAVFPSPGTDLPAPGRRVTVAGFAEMDPFRVELREALVRDEGPAPAAVTSARQLSLADLYTGKRGQFRINTELRGCLASLSGTVRDRLFMDDRLISLTLVDGAHTLTVDLSALEFSASDLPETDAVLRLTGFLVPEFEPLDTANVLPRFRCFTLFPRTNDDVVVLVDPPWWTPARLFLVILSLLAALAAILVWNVVLKRKSERRGRELYDEQIGHALAEQKVEERTRLAVELHDSLSQTLTGIALQLDGGETATAKTMLAACRGELRRCLWDLRSRTFEEKDMTEAVTRTIAPHLNGTEATVRFNVPRERLSESVTHAVLRIVRELVVNAIHHGQARHIKVAGEYHDGTISFSVKDDGTGFDPATAPGPEQGHFGLLGIRERLEDFNGELKIESEPGRGARVAVTLDAGKDDDGE